MTTEATEAASITPIEIPKLGCPETLMPTPADMKNMIKQIAALPAKIIALIQVQAATMKQDEIDGLMSEVEQLQEVVEKVLDVIDAPNFKSIEWPDLRGEIGIDKLMQKYPTFLITEILKIIAKIMADGSIKHNQAEGSIHKVAATILGAESCNGWTYWHCDVNGKIVPIDSLRQRLISKS